MFHEHSKESGEGLRTLAAPLGTISCPANKGGEQPNGLDSSVLVGCGAATVEAKLSQVVIGGAQQPSTEPPHRGLPVARGLARGDRRDSGIVVTAEACGSSCPSL